MKNLVVAVAGLLLLGTVMAAPAGAPRRSVYNDANYGFSLDAPAFSSAGKGQTVVPVILTGPNVNGFASNVNVVVSSITTTRKGYRDLTLAGMKQANMKINEDRDVTVSGRDAIRYDYEGKNGGKEVHFLALAVIDKDRVVVVTCTALASEFKAMEPEFRACLDSFQLK
jgi:hypothetical protein